ncbi:MAG: twitching motility protein PilJ [Gammaproteobacteria bacterium]|jgi:twitching motility protein PilJ|nr:chemotaxis protein [Gammaproteobacteria bacterium]MEA3141099.1 twitching motility protein PilJ [Gammaproteobacteria bacterium]
MTTKRNDTAPNINLLPILAGFLLLCLLAVAILTAVSRSSAPVAAPAEQMSLVVQRIPFEAQNALRGEASAFDALDKSAARLKSLRSAAPGLGDAASWGKLNDSVTTVAQARPAVEAIQAANQEVRELAPKLLSELGDLGSSVGVQKLEGMSRFLERFELAVQRIQQELNGLGTGVSDAAPSAQRLADSLEFLNQVIRGLSGEESGIPIQRVTGADPEQRLKTVVQRHQQYTASVRKAIGAADPLSKAQAAARALPSLANTLTTQLAGASPRDENGGGFKGLILALLVVAVLLLGALAWTYLQTADQRRNNELRVRENERNQEAIMRLLDELSSLADGDLTVQATVTEDITGAIADSINYAIEALRELVTTINDSAIQLDSAAKQTQGAAAHMAKASSAQSRQISSASESMADMAASIEEVSGNSERCSDVARHSVDVAHKGGDAVRRTIDGMNAIRETIQETSKRIKRLGESSQEIGNIVELINDIAEQTNILALNASIQASMAGEAGRGFAVVADEVQRLAERAANATKQIEVLVRTIQTDTNEAVVSMERSTTDVVGGALLAENAGAALGEIEQVSNQIASLVQNISASARQQAAASGNISKNMQVVREISSQTAEGSTATSTSIAKLAALSAQLRKSVSGFRLPDYGGGPKKTSGSAPPAPAPATAPKLTAVPESAPPAAPGKMRKASGIGA